MRAVAPPFERRLLVWGCHRGHSQPGGRGVTRHVAARRLAWVPPTAMGVWRVSRVWEGTPQGMLRRGGGGQVFAKRPNEGLQVGSSAAMRAGPVFSFSIADLPLARCAERAAGDGLGRGARSRDQRVLGSVCSPFCGSWVVFRGKDHHTLSEIVSYDRDGCRALANGWRGGRDAGVHVGRALRGMASLTQSCRDAVGPTGQSWRRGRWMGGGGAVSQV